MAMALWTPNAYVGIMMLLGNGDGTFTPGQFTTTVSRGQRLAAADQNRVGALDLVTSLANGSSMYLMGNGNGSFQAPVPMPASTMNKVVATDLNAGGKPDLVFAGSGNTAMVLYKQFPAN
jgi:hypothetical protein